MDDALRAAERRGDDERVAALRRRAGRPPAELEPLLPGLRAGLDELVAARAESDRIRQQHRWVEAEFDDALIAAEERLEALSVALFASSPHAARGLEWLTFTELQPGAAPRGEALEQLSQVDDEELLLRLAASPDHEVHGPALRRLERAGSSQPTRAAEAVRMAIDGCQLLVARAAHLAILVGFDASGSIGHFERHLTDANEEVQEVAVRGLLAAGRSAFDALVRAVGLGAGSSTAVWDQLLRFDRTRGLAAAVACVTDPGCDRWARREATRQLLLEDRPRAWDALVEATRLTSPDLEPWRWLAALDLPRAMTLAAERVAPDWPESEVAPLQAALDALVRCGDSRAAEVLLRERARPGNRGAWAAERHRAWTQICLGAWRGGWED